MIKAMAQTESGPLIVLGISDANVDRMREDDPILFNLRDLNLPSKWVCISCKRPDGTAAFPADLDEFIGLAFKPKILRRMRRKPVEVEIDDYRFVLFRGADESSMAAEMRGLIGVNTRVTDSRPITMREPHEN